MLLNSAKVDDGDGPLLPIGEDGRGVLDRNDFRYETCRSQSSRVEDGTSPLGDPARSGEKPEREVSAGDDDVRIDLGDFSLELVETSADFRGNPVSFVLSVVAVPDVDLALGEPVLELPIGRPSIDDVGQVAFTPHDARFVEHPVEFLARGTGERFLAMEVILGIDLPDD